MIPVKKEPPDMYENTRVYERCIFCNIETDMWHEKTNTPVCTTCSKTYNVKDIKDFKKY